jgi:regulator of sigma D
MKVLNFNFILYDNNDPKLYKMKMTNLLNFEVNQIQNLEKYNEEKLNKFCENIKYYIQNGAYSNLIINLDKNLNMFELLVYFKILGYKGTFPVLDLDYSPLSIDEQYNNILHKLLKIKTFTEKQLDNFKKIIITLINDGINLLDYNADGESVLMLAKKLGNKEIIKLIEDASLTGNNGISPPHNFITKKEDLFPEIIHLLNSSTMPKIHFVIYTPSKMFIIIKYRNIIWCDTTSRTYYLGIYINS